MKIKRFKKLCKCIYINVFSHYGSIDRWAFNISVTEFAFWNIQDYCCNFKQGSPKDSYIPHRYSFRTFCFSLNLTGTLNLSKLYTTTGQEWENRKYKLFDQLPKYSWMYEHRPNEDNICTKLDGNPSLHK